MTRIVAILAHPDDAEILAGGTLYKHRQRGDSVEICSVTYTPDSMRGQEGAVGAQRLGADFTCLGLPGAWCPPAPRRAGRAGPWRPRGPLQDHHLPLVLSEPRAPLGRLDLLRVRQLLEAPVGRLHGGLSGLEVGERAQGAQTLDFLLRHLERAHGVVMAALHLRLGRLGRLRSRLPGRLQGRTLLAAGCPVRL